jgi:hypothetical protein
LGGPGRLDEVEPALVQALARQFGFVASAADPVATPAPSLPVLIA